jgi:uncharacterized protein
MDNNTLLSIIDPKRLELILFPTEKCNFRCTYCYEDFAIGKMKPDIINSVKKLIERRSTGIDQLYLSWFGGEPLLAKDVVFEISEFAMKCVDSTPSLNYSGGVTTNGYLLNPILFKKLIDLRIVDYQISLDGYKDVHDLTRKRANGSGSFDVIWKNLLDIREMEGDFIITLRVHYHRHNIGQLDELMEAIAREFSQDKRFKCLPQAVEQHGSENDYLFDKLSHKTEEEVLAKFKSGFNKTGFIKDKEEMHVCYASKPNSLMIRADGRIGKCTVALNDEINTIGKINEDGTVVIDQKRAQFWMRGIFEDNEETLACPMTVQPELVKIYLGNKAIC